jgi:hypothetical protein
MPDAGQDGHRQVADVSCQVVVVEPGEVIDGAAATNDDDRIRQAAFLVSPLSYSSLQSIANFLGCALPLEATVGINEPADTKLLKSVSFCLEVAKAGTAGRSDD